MARQASSPKRRNRLSLSLQEFLDGAIELQALDQIRQIVSPFTVPDKERSGGVLVDPLLIVLVESAQVGSGHIQFAWAAPLLHSPSYGADAASEMNHEVRRPEVCLHCFVHLHVRVEVSGRHFFCGVEVSREDLGVLIDRPILDPGSIPRHDFLMESKLVGQEPHLAVEGPPLHVFVEGVEIGIVLKGLVGGREAVGVGEVRHQRGLADPNVARNSNELLGHEALTGQGWMTIHSEAEAHSHRWIIDEQGDGSADSGEAGEAATHRQKVDGSSRF